MPEASGLQPLLIHFYLPEAEDTRRSALPDIEREILMLREARSLAPMIDIARRMVAALAAIDARAAVLGVRR